MKNFKLIFAILLAALFTFVGGKAFADTTYSLTISGTSEGHTYEAYQIFSGDLSSDGTTLSNIAWGSGVTAFTYDNATDAATIAEKISGEKYDSTTAKAFAKLAGANVTTASGSATSSAGSTVISGLAPGYYLVKDKDESQNGKNAAYTRFILQVVGDATAQLKNDTPTVQKKVKDTNDTAGTTTDWQDSADYDIGDTIPFQLKATLPAHISEYDHYYVEFTDTLSAGLTFDKITKVTADGTTLTSDQYTVTTTSNSAGTTTLSVIITDVKAVATITKDDDIVVEYNATLNSKAVIGSAGNPNKVKLTYSNNPNNTGDGTSKPGDTGETPEDTVIVFTYKVVVNKVKEDGTSPLEGAGFTLYKKDSSGKWNEVETISAGDTTTFTFSGLDDGDYKLVETTVPDGYNKASDVEFTISASHSEEADEPKLISLSVDQTSADFTSSTTDGSLTTDVVNKKGSVLPSTGGMGTTILYVVGTILVLAAGILLVTKKRMDAK
ncbi:fimbrial subunit B protein [Streptococcus gallolyticus]|uniref:Fimbrial subunit B protein n=1 Tax=Streptococcus gallolyticus TaxID=315405 RepID=A0AA94M426_9STRE|nr:SpaH/EbpB family LPXTG-anchored major pilin [Streptococcus gallolyticus]AQP43308.1 fimbrial subunit B protein [Streptococcus gallolyticus subsp. gallolyticus DSM 16831]SQG80607.1 fimbrial subunit B protein [Streptococcus gallolyticus]